MPSKIPVKKSPAKKTVAKKAAAKTKAKPTPFRLTYATMFNPPEELHTRYDKALQTVKGQLGQDHPMFINGQSRFTSNKFESRSPINTDWVLGTFQTASAQDVSDAVSAAEAAFPQWSALKWQDRVKALRKLGTIIEKRVYELSAAMSLEVGKNRLEALGDVQEAADFIWFFAEQMEANSGYIKQMSSDPLVGFKVTNMSVLRPYGVWGVISPFNFPVALSAGPSLAALITGNTVVCKPAEDTTWSVALLAQCFRDADLPEGVFNFITGDGEVGKALVDDPRLAGITFTGSYDVGMSIYRKFAGGPYPRPVIAEMGGKNVAIVSRNANLDDAALGIMRSAFGLQGQKCSACSRIFVDPQVKDKLADKLVTLTRERVTVGDPTERPIYMGPVINETAYRAYSEYTEDLSGAGEILYGGRQLTEGALGKGYFVMPTIADRVPTTHRLWKHEMFLPITMMHAADSLEAAMGLANGVNYGLTAGFYGSKKETQWFFENIQAGVTYAHRPQGATTGAWPGFQPFGGWKASGSTGKNGGGLYYLPLYMHEQVHTNVEKT
jgi:1-pyrroline-5-carboxylate dehydrogenase